MVSIIIPTHKGQNHILNAVLSVISQDYKPVEIIIVDDNGAGSIDQKETENVLNKLIQEQRVKYIVHDKNMNGAVARNTGLNIAQGKYIAFLDDDDRFLSCKLSLQVNQLEKTSETIGASYSSKIQKLDNKIVKIDYAKKTGDLLLKHHMHQVSIGTASLLIKKNVLDKIGGFNPTFVRHQDWEFVGRILNDYEIIPCRNAFYERNLTYRHTPDNLLKYYEFMKHYIDTLSTISPRLSNRQLNLITSKNLASVALKFIRNRKFSYVFKIFRSHKNPLFLFYMVLGIVRYPFTRLNKN